jgi:hypothetical protein
LELAVNDYTHNPFRHLAPWTGLKWFSLAMPEGTRLYVEDFTQIQRMSHQLRSLRLRSLLGSEGRLHAPCFTDDSLRTLLKACPRLRSLQLGLTTRLSTYALRLIGEERLLLQDLELPCSIDFRSMETARTPLFSRLSNLTIGGVVQHCDDG